MKYNYVLLDGRTLKDTDRVFCGSSPSAAAKKAASRGMKRILLRRTGTSTVHEYAGSVKKLNRPKKVERNGTVITYRKETVIKKKKMFSRP